MRLFCSLVICCFCFVFSASAGFVSGLEDIPLADGLQQQESESLNFGNEESRLIEAYFKSETLSFAEVASFYKTTLPQLGWRLKSSKKDALLFEREGELLTIHKETIAPLTIRLTVKSGN